MSAKKKTGRSKGRLALIVRQFRRNKLAVVGMCILLFLVIVCSMGDFITPYLYSDQNMLARFQGPSLEHLLGTDQYGRDMLTRLLKGGQISLLVSAAAVVLAAVFSMVIGASAAYIGGKYEMIVMRLIDALQSIPALLLACGVSMALGAGLWKSVIAMAISRIAHMSRIMYSTALTVVGAEYLEAARARGASKVRMVLRYIIPNCLAPMIVQITMQLGTCITQIASLSFLGLGVKPPMPEWGSILNEGRQFIRSDALLVIFPGIAIALTLISVNLIGDGLRDALDPKLKR